MSHPNAAPNTQTYEPLPLTTDDHIGHALYNAPPDVPPSPSYTPQFSSRELPDDDYIQSSVAQPRFLGRALYSEGGPGMRESFASHQSFASEGGSQYTSSVYALNDGPGAPPLSQYGGYRDDPDALDPAYRGDMAMSPMGRNNRFMEEKRAVYAPPRSKRKVMIWAIVAGVALLLIIIVVALYFAVIKPKSKGSAQSDTANSGTGSSSPNPTGSPDKSATLAVTGGDGSVITMEDGTTFTYNNSFGGYWYWDENDPFNNGARAQSWSPALNETFNYGVDRIRGVNLGGWLTLEPFISPAVFELYYNGTPRAVDEWTLHTRMAADTTNGGFNNLENHYKTFITEQDFAQIAGAGLNYVRIPLPYWAIETRTGEPFLAHVAWTYFLKAIQWARKYGIRINLDLHAVPGSQNGWNHSGRLGSINVLEGPMGYANAQRTLDYIRILAEFISQPEYRNVVTMFSILNEPDGTHMGQDVLSSFYYQAYQIVRNASGTGEGNGPYVGLHDGFFTRDQWAGFLPNSDRVALDDHPYICFGGQSSAPMSSYATTPCGNWGILVNTSMGAFGLTVAGEFSNAVTDCGLWLNGVDQGTRYEGDWVGGASSSQGSCTIWTDYRNYDQPTKAAIKTFALASMDALQNWFFWTWKIGASNVTGQIESPAWSYQLGLQQGWMPHDPRDAVGQCKNANPWSPPLQPWQTGGSGAGSIPATFVAGLPWPPATISVGGGPVTLLPSYTPTGVVPTLTGPTFTPTATGNVNVGNGWNNAADTAGLMVNMAGCSYLDPWVGSAAPPSPLCSS